MKLVTLVIIALSAISAGAQNNNGPQGPIPGVTVLPPNPIQNFGDLNLQTGCPVAFTNVVFKQNARYMPVKLEPVPESSLEFNYKNLSGKQIESISVRVELRAKRSVYDLDAVTLTRDMTLTGHSGEVLPLSFPAYGLVRVTLEQVTYAGGDVWTPTKHADCSYQNNGLYPLIRTPQ
jgi:hypothetical protein